MFKTFFITREPETEIDFELERTILVIQERMEKIIASQEVRRQRFATLDNTPIYYR